MIYELKKNLHNDFRIFEQNKLEPRAYAIPFSDIKKLKKTDVRKERYTSDMADCLSGDWDFKFYDSISRLPNKLNTLKINFNKIQIPSDWQRTGFQEPVYLNCPYEFKTFEPNVPDDMPVGVYRKFFEAEKDGREYIISFLGVANNISLYVNGTYIGYSEGTHNTAEFNITDALKNGTNELVAVSFKWCNGSFLEAQDMFRENGIFRDVILFKYQKTYLKDYYVETSKTSKGYKLRLNLDIEGAASGFTVYAELADGDNKTLYSASSEAKVKTVIDFGTVSVNEWTPETPNVYNLYITLSDKNASMTVRNITGFKSIEIKDGVFYFNKTPVKLFGVNHHDTNLYKGYVMSFEDMENDISTMKSLNVNAVRTSHYPPDPFFLILADIYGLYIVDEADIETHGCWEMAQNVDYISRQKKWISHYVDRVKRMYYRDRNHPSITMWSLGNEAGGYRCQDACYDFLKSTGTTIPVHYEGVVRTKRFHYDVISEMYTSTQEIEKMIEGKRRRNNRICKEYSDYPFYLCEYAHAMGVGPGNLKEYTDLFLSWKNSMGGCIWEWADHTVFHPDNDKKYKYRYTYGGDHGEKQHDGHFCVDGLMYSDRTPHTGAKEMKVAYRPLRAEWDGKNTFRFTNINRFISSDYIDINWKKLVNGVETANGEFGLDIPPMKSKTVKIDLGNIAQESDCHINFIYTDKNTGREIAVEQLTLNDVAYEYDIPIGEKISVASDDEKYEVVFENGKAVFSKDGDILSYVVNKKELLASKDLASAFEPNLFRALIDNDSANRDSWTNKGLDKLKKVPVNVNVSIKDGAVLINTEFSLKSGRKKLYGFSIDYLISSLGAIEVTASLKPLSVFAPTDIPRFGIILGLSRSFENASYYGRGEAENMPDFLLQSPVGRYGAKIDDMYEKYVYPQESGMHCDVKELTLTGKAGKLSFFAEDRFAFCVHHFTQAALEKAEHQEDISDMGLTCLNIDGFVRGIGSSSCGPDTREEYRLDCSKGYEFSFTIIPE